MQIINLVENTVFSRELKAEHGLSFVLIDQEYKILFDTGQSSLFLENAEKLNLDLSQIDYVILSHGHYDHSGGLKDFLKINKKAKIMMKKEVLKEKFHKKKDSYHDISFPFRKNINDFASRIIFVNNNTQLFENLYIFCEIKTKKLPINNTHYSIRVNETWQTDYFDDELFVVVKNEEKYSIITGCSHRGIVNIIDTVSQYFSISSLQSIIGGLHLKNKSLDELKIELELLKEIEIKQIYTCHCTGLPAYNLLKKFLKQSQVHYFSTGDKLLL